MSNFQLAWLSRRLYSCLVRHQSNLVRQSSACRQLYSNSKQDDVKKQDRHESHYDERDRRRKIFTKLHRRVLTEETLTKEKRLDEIRNLDESDAFGNLVKSSKSKSQKSESDNNSEWIDVRDSQRKELLNNTSDFVIKSRRNVQYDADWSDARYEKQFPKKKYRNDSNKFGTLGRVEADEEESLFTEMGSHNERFSDDKDDYNRHHIRLATNNRRHSQDWYGLKMEKLGRQGKVKEAVEVLEEWMLKRDRVMPSTYTFTVLIGILGRAGYTKKAFHLFNKMKKMGLQPVDLTYTSLFNACANSPWRADGLSRADKLRSLMQHKGHEPNLITYHAMIKAHAVHGDLRTSFVIMDELLERFQPTAETFSFLLMACISDRKAGFKHAVEVWRLLRKFKVIPDMFLYNLLLRTVRDCGVGDASFASQLLGQNQKLALGSRNLTRDVQENLVVESETEMSATVSKSTVDAVSDQGTLTKTETKMSEWWENGNIQESTLPSTFDQDQTVTLPNLLDPDCDLSQVVSVGELRCPGDRLAVIGGVAGFLNSMVSDDASPDVRTFTQLVEVAPSTNEAEMALLAKMESLGVKPDITFFNTVIHKRCLRRDGEAARALLEQVSAANLHPDIHTFGCLAMTCRKKKDGMQLLKDMDQSGVAPNIEILGTLAFASNMDFGYKLAILQEVENFDMRPNEKFIEVVERSISNAKQKIVQVEKGILFDDFISSQYFQSSFRDFMTYYKTWLHKTPPEERSHPWKALQPQTDDDAAKQENNN